MPGSQLLRYGKTCLERYNCHDLRSLKGCLQTHSLSVEITQGFSRAAPMVLKKCLPMVHLPTRPALFEALTY